MHVINIVSKKVGWKPIAFVPSVAGQHEPMAKAKAAQTRAEVLLRTLAMVFYRCMIHSHCGAELLLCDGTKVIVCPRVLLYVCDQPEERAVMGLKQNGSTYDCTPCMARYDASTNIGKKRPRARSVLKTVTAQMRKASLRRFYGMGRTIEDLETDYSVRYIVPALAGWAGLGSGCFMLYKLPGFDRLHVRKVAPPKTRQSAETNSDTDMLLDLRTSGTRLITWQKRLPKSWCETSQQAANVQLERPPGHCELAWRAHCQFDCPTTRRVPETSSFASTKIKRCIGAQSRWKAGRSSVPQVFTIKYHRMIGLNFLTVFCFEFRVDFDGI